MQQAEPFHISSTGPCGAPLSGEVGLIVFAEAAETGDDSTGGVSTEFTQRGLTNMPAESFQPMEIGRLSFTRGDPIEEGENRPGSNPAGRTRPA